MRNIRFILFFLAFFIVQAYSSSYDKILLEDLKSFTVFKNRMTKGRRSRVLQLECVEGDACQYFQPSSMYCTQIGFDGYNASWKCDTQLQDYYYIGYTKVSCEGYKNPDDRYITRDSCGVRYSLYLTEKGKDHFYSDNNDNTRSRNNYRRNNNYNNNNTYDDNDSGFYILVVIAIIIVGYICHRFYKSWKERHNRNNNNNNNDQPPPYGSWENDYDNDHRDDDNHHHHHYHRHRHNSGSRTGFFSSSTTSRIADFLSGYMTGNNMRNRNDGSHTTYNNYYGSSSSRSRSRSRSRSPPRGRSSSPPQTYSSYGNN